jgi:hypothetical protein
MEYATSDSQENDEKEELHEKRTDYVENLTVTA